MIFADAYFSAGYYVGAVIFLVIVGLVYWSVGRWGVDRGDHPNRLRDSFSVQALPGSVLAPLGFAGCPGPVERQSGLTHEDLEDFPAIWTFDRLDVGVCHQQRLSHECEAPRRVEEWARDSPYLVAGWIKYRDLVGADKSDIHSAGACDSQ